MHDLKGIYWQDVEPKKMHVCDFSRIKSLKINPYCVCFPLLLISHILPPCYYSSLGRGCALGFVIFTHSWHKKDQVEHQKNKE